MLTTLKAFSADRLIPPQMRTGAAVKRFAVLVGLCFLVHIGLVMVALLGEDYLAKAPIQPQVIPVELIEEQPPEAPQEKAEDKPEEKPEEKPQEQAQEKAPEQPPPPKEEQEPEKAEAPPPPPPEKLEPAMDFARVSEKEIENKTAGGPVIAEREEPAPVAQAEPPKAVEQAKVEQKPLPEPPKAEPPKAEPPKPQPPVAQAPQEPPPSDATPPEPEGLLAGAESPPAPTEQSAEATPESAPAPASTQPENPIGKRFAFFEPVPKMEFDAGVKSSRTPTGTAPANYNSTLYGMIVPLIHFPQGALQIGRRGPAIVGFIVDGHGRLAGISIVRASGVPSIDMAVVLAIRQAAPYPPPPNGQPLGLELHY